MSEKKYKVPMGMPAPAPQVPKKPLFPNHRNPAMEKLLASIPPEKRITRDMMYDRLVDNWYDRLPGNQPAPKENTEERQTSPTHPSLSRTRLPPLPHLDRFRARNDPENIRANERQNLIDSGYNVANFDAMEPHFNATRPVSEISSNYSFSNFYKRLEPLDSDVRSSRPSSSSTLESNTSNDSKIFYQELSPQDVVSFLNESEEPDKFVYVVFAYPKDHIKYDYFKLRIVPFNALTDVNGHDHSLDFFTASKRDGLVRLKTTTVNPDNAARVDMARTAREKKFAKLQGLITPGEQQLEHTSLDRWVEEYLNHKKLMKKRTFSKFSLARAFNVWKTTVRREKTEKIKKILTNDLYILNSELRPALMSVRQLSDQIAEQNLCRIKDGETYRYSIIVLVRAKFLKFGVFI